MNSESVKLLLIDLLSQPDEVQKEFLSVNQKSSGYSKKAFISMLDAALNYWSYVVKRQFHENLRIEMEALIAGSITFERFKDYEEQTKAIKYPLFHLTGGKYIGHIGLSEVTLLQSLVDSYKSVKQHENLHETDFTRHSSDESYQNEFMEYEIALIEYLQQYAGLGIEFKLYDEINSELGAIDLKELDMSKGSYHVEYFQNKSLDLKTSIQFCQQRWLSKNALYTWGDFLKEEILFIEKIPIELRREYEFQIGPILKQFKEMKETKSTPSFDEVSNNAIPSKDLEGFDSIFTQQAWQKYVNVLRDCKPRLVDSQNEFVGKPKKHKGVICSWFKYLQFIGVIKTNVNRKDLSKVLNSEFKNFNLGADGKTFDNVSKAYEDEFKMQFMSVF